ncbi:hypothetical protein HGRIS_013230 [Hohenbuehelia grisea]|uniref:Chromatin assembly factor 1 subunit A dimerization domain-containing protein n=1 Tax=Hohenbuehelia grisea TaxID=104357 RepID=A0ABR3IUQ8_9AGAR
MSASTSSTPTTDVPQPPDKSNIVELKNGKVVFKQKPISFEKLSETMQGIVSLRALLEERIEKQDSPFTDFPEEHRPLIAKLAHESDKSLSVLAKHLSQELNPMPEDDEQPFAGSSHSGILPASALEAAISSILERNNYGLDSLFTGAKPPAAISVWRWEVKPEYWDWLPKASREKAEARMQERMEAKKYLLAIFEALPQVERDKILDPKGTKGSISVNKMNSTKATKESPAKTPAKKPNGKGKEENDAVSESPILTEKTKTGDASRVTKTKERDEKKVAMAEKEKNEKNAQNKSRSLMASFLGMHKPSKATSPSKAQSPSHAGPSTSMSEFERTFKPFVLKKDAQLAPLNFFRCKEKDRRPARDVIVIDADDDPPVMTNSVLEPLATSVDDEASLSQMSRDARLSSALSLLNLSTTPPRRRLRRGATTPFKTFHPLAVRDIMTQLSEAEVTGDEALVRTLLKRLRDRQLIPAKVLIFADDARPGYFGTWTRNSRIIGPRTPIARDFLVLDYSYDSGEEWEEETPGDADDVNDDGEEEDDNESVDSDVDSWLVDDEEELEQPLEEREPSPLLPDIPLPALTGKRKAEPGHKKLTKKRKVVVPLVPFARGPCWESTIGHCEFDLLKPYRIQLFNDTPFPIDPFAFISTPIEDLKAPECSSEAIAPTNGSTPAKAVDSSMPPPSVPTIVKRTALAPKTPFPEAHLPFLLTKIQSLQAASITYLVEAIFQDLRAHKVKKNAIEAKVREVGEKCKQNKYWVVKPGLLATAQGLSPA